MPSHTLACPAGRVGEGHESDSAYRVQELDTSFGPLPSSRRSRAIRCACCFVLRRLTLYAIRKVLAPATVAPQHGTNSEGPKSGDHSGLVSYACVYVHVLGHRGHLHLKVSPPTRDDQNRGTIHMEVFSLAQVVITPISAIPRIATRVTICDCPKTARDRTKLCQHCCHPFLWYTE